MILPSKHLPEDRSLLAVGARILGLICDDSTVSSVWDQMRVHNSVILSDDDRLSFDWFILALDFLFIAGLIELKESRIKKVSG